MFFGRKTQQNARELSFDARRTSDHGGTLHLALKGPITEHSLAGFDKLMSTIKQHPDCEIIFNMSAVSFMNSIGIQQWMQFLKKIPPCNPLCLEECTPEIVEHLNMLHGFRGRARVASFQVPYICTSCQRRTVVVLRTAELPRGTPPEAPQCRCGKAMEAEEPEDEYFQFLENL